ncbi:hypothetical protein E8E11_003199 [Didymella keratinophila]|nr:hypothetical protein E8E11_003199 [Didymella keratinophila]
MLLGLDTVSPFHNILASLFVWILLAGYIVFPATFNSLQKSSYDAKANTALKAEALKTARNLPLLAQDGQYSVTAKVTVVVTAACSVVAAALFLLYNTVMLNLVKRKHEKEIRAVERDGEGIDV